MAPCLRRAAIALLLASLAPSCALMLASTKTAAAYSSPSCVSRRLQLPLTRQEPHAAVRSSMAVMHEGHFAAALNPRAGVLFISNLPRPVKIWAAIFAIATFLKNLSKQMNANKLTSRKLQDSGECPWPFIFFHEPIYGLKKYARLNAICVAWVTRKHVVGWFVRRLGLAAGFAAIS